MCVFPRVIIVITREIRTLVKKLCQEVGCSASRRAKKLD